MDIFKVLKKRERNVNLDVRIQKKSLLGIRVK